MRLPLDDGMTSRFQTAAGVAYIRPMLRAHRKWVSEDTDARHMSVFEPPWYLGPDVAQLTTEESREIARRVFSSDREERDWVKDVRESVLLLHEHSGLVLLPCDTCRNFATNHATGEVLRLPDGQRQRRPNLPVPCEIASQGCPKGHWSNPREPSERGLKVWEHYWQVRATGQIVDDPLFAVNAAYIDWVVLRGRSLNTNPTAGGNPGGPARPAFGS